MPSSAEENMRKPVNADCGRGGGGIGIVIVGGGCETIISLSEFFTLEKVYGVHY